MSEDVVIKFASPTLAGIKTGAIFGYPCASPEEAFEDVREMNRVLSPKGITAVPLCTQQGRVLLYLYRPKSLSQDLRDTEALRLLEDAGYHSCSASRCVAELSRKLRGGGPFPHEIGLFIGYPPEDVQGFIENRARNYKCIGCWKVYGDVESAKKRFVQFERCTRAYMRYHAEGHSLAELAVSV